jgi:hypothetical protein
MPIVADRPGAPTAIQTDLAAIFISLELSRSIWLMTSLSPGGGQKMSKRSVPAGDVAALLARFSELKRKGSERTGNSFPIVVIQEAGLDGFWLHRVLQSEGVESHVVDPASIATSRRRRRAKTDKIIRKWRWSAATVLASMRRLRVRARRRRGRSPIAFICCRTSARPSSDSSAALRRRSRILTSMPEIIRRRHRFQHLTP